MVVCRMLLNIISLGVRVSHPITRFDALDPLDNHLKIIEEYRPYEVEDWFTVHKLIPVPWNVNNDDDDFVSKSFE